MKKLILLALVTMSVSLAQAGMVFSPAFTHMSRELTDNNNPTQNEELTMIDVKLGYIFEMGLYVGGLYSLIEDELSDSTSGSSDFHFGPSVGYYNSGFMVTGTFYVFGQRDQERTNTKFDSVSGYQIDLAYVVPVNSSFSIGPQMTYQTVEYSDAQVDSLSSETNYKWEGFTPYIALMFMF